MLVTLIAIASSLSGLSSSPAFSSDAARRRSALKLRGGESPSDPDRWSFYDDGTGTTVVQRKTEIKITHREILDAQAAWGGAVVAISKEFAEGGDFLKMAAEAASSLYGYERGAVLFKPTKAAALQFRSSSADAMSYFIGSKYVGDGAIDEDKGFAINGGAGWSAVKFENHGIIMLGDAAIAMGNYFFTDATTGEISKVEFTFGYRKFDDGHVSLFLHHSSIPYSKQ